VGGRAVRKGHGQVSTKMGEASQGQPAEAAKQALQLLNSSESGFDPRLAAGAEETAISLYWRDQSQEWLNQRGVQSPQCRVQSPNAHLHR
jgi:hypothetical protein